MKRRLLVTIISCAFILVACSGGEPDQVAIDDASNIALSENAVISMEISSDASSEVASFETPKAENVDEDLYRKFLENKEKVIIGDNNLPTYYFSLEECRGQEFALEELADYIAEFYAADASRNRETDLDDIEYAYIDCGNDGVEELLLHIKTPTNTEDWKEYIVVKDIDGQLETVYSDVAWSRKRIFFNQYGYIFGDGSNGATNHGFDKAFIDEEGQYHFLYSDNVASGLNTETGIELAEDYVYFTFDFNNTEDDESDDVFTYARYDYNSEHDWEEGFKDIFYADVIRDETLYEDSNPLKQYYEQMGRKINTLDEVEQMIILKEQQEGLTADIKDGEAVKFQVIGN